jgi:hypothetical protein
MVSPAARDRLARVVAVIATHFLPGCPYHANRGSVTFQNPSDTHEVVCVFVDDGNRLATREGLSLSPEPIVVAVELESQPAFARRAIRDGLLLRFPLYLDPTRPPYRQYYVAPNADHPYDIIFLPEGPCPFDVDERILEHCRDAVESAGAAKVMKARRKDVR